MNPYSPSLYTCLYNIYVCVCVHINNLNGGIMNKFHHMHRKWKKYDLTGWQTMGLNCYWL